MPWTGGLNDKGGQLMKKENYKILNWIKEHKVELIIGGLCIAGIVAIIISEKNRQEMEDEWVTLSKQVRKTLKAVKEVDVVSVVEDTPVKDLVENNVVKIDRIPHDVSEHLRNLPQGWKASEEKIATAVEHGYNLVPGQTWVEAYKTGGLAA